MLEHYLTVCAIFKDEASYLDEWLNFHIANGVDHFFLYDNLSSDNANTVLSPFIAEGYVTLTKWPTRKSDGGQRKAYKHCLETFGASSTWIAFIDIDEFLFGVTNDLPEVLRDYERHAGVFVHWQNYGSSKMNMKELGSVISRFTQRAPTQWSRNREGKCIVQPNKLAKLANDEAHDRVPPQYKVASGEQLVTERREPLPQTVTLVDQVAKWLKNVLGTHAVNIGSKFPMLFNPYGSRKGNPSKVSVSVLRINHYVVKSREEYALKVKRMSDKPQKYNEFFFRFHDRNEITDRILADRLGSLQSKAALLRSLRGAARR